MDRYPALERVRHAELHAVIDTDARVLVVPVPGAGTTPLLDLIARAAKADEPAIDGRDTSSAAAALHDIARWPAEHRWSDLAAERRDEIANAEDWLRIASTADPAARLWAAWQYVVLLRQDEADARFGEQSWFPGRIADVTELVDAFRSFVRALDQGDLLFQEPRWTPQSLLLEQMPAGIRVHDEHQVAEAVALLGERLGVAPAGPLVEETVPFAYHPGVYDAATAAIVNRVYEPDRQRWNYPALVEDDTELPALWRDVAAGLLPVVLDLAERNVRHAELRRRWLAAEKQVDLERGRNAQLRERLDQRWDTAPVDRAGLVALMERADTAEADLAGAHHQLAWLREATNGSATWRRTKQRTRATARRVRDRLRNTKDQA